MQARLFSLVINGERQLPTKEEMRKVTEIDTENWTMRFKNDAIRVKGLVDFQIYCDGLAKIIGCMPPLRELFFKRPVRCLASTYFNLITISCFHHVPYFNAVFGYN